jgi:hypothetical protein
VVFWALKRAVTLRQGRPNACRWNSGRSGLGRWSSLRPQRGDCKLASLLCVRGQVTMSWPIFSASAAGQLRAGWSSLCWQPGYCEPAGLPCIGWWCCC